MNAMPVGMRDRAGWLLERKTRYESDGGAAMLIWSVTQSRSRFPAQVGFGGGFIMLQRCL